MRGITFPDLDCSPDAVWILLATSGYLRMDPQPEDRPVGGIPAAGELCKLSITNLEMAIAFDKMVRGWFAAPDESYNDRVEALLAGDLKAMNVYMNKVALETFSTFDSENRPSSAEPERFYHGFVLGLLVELRGRYVVESNRESGFGRCDVVLEPLDKTSDDGIVLEFKVCDHDEADSLQATVGNALAQVDEKGYATSLAAHGVPADRIRSYGFAFRGKPVLIGR